MKTKTVNIPDALFERMTECMARTKIFNASEFIRLSVDSAVERVERKYKLGSYAEEKPEAAFDLSELTTPAPTNGTPQGE